MGGRFADRKVRPGRPRMTFYIVRQPGDYDGAEVHIRKPQLVERVEMGETSCRWKPVNDESYSGQQGFWTKACKDILDSLGLWPEDDATMVVTTALALRTIRRRNQKAVS